MRIDRWAAAGALICALVCVGGSVLEAQVSTIQGRVRDEEGSAVYGATVRVMADSTLLGATDTDRLGSFRFSMNRSGEFTLIVQGLGYGETIQEVSVRGSETVELDVRLPRQAIEMEGISVQAERSRERVRFEEIGGATVREFNLAELRSLPGVVEADPIRAVEVLPGVVSTSDFSASYHVRGGSSDQNLILLDGVPIFSPFHLGGFFSVFNADMLDRAELQSGGFAAEHGGRVSSVLQIESDAGDGEFKVDAGVSLLATRVAIGAGLPRKTAESLGLANLKWRVSARRSYFDVLMKPVFEFPYHLTDLQAVVEGWTRSGDRVMVTGYSGADVLDLTRLDPESFPLRIDWDWGNDIAGLRWTRARRGGGSLDVRVNTSRFGTGLTFPDFGDTDFSSRIQQGQLRIDLDTRPSSTMAFKVGGALERTSYKNSFTSGGTVFGSGEGAGMLMGTYAQAGWSRPGRWLVEAGLRLDTWMPDPGETAYELAPRLAVKRFLSNGDVALKLAAGRYTQFIHSLRDEELPLGLDIWVTAGARAPHVVSDQVQLGLEGYLDDDWFWAVEAYARSFDGVVMFNPAEDPNDEFDDILAGSGLAYGSDLLVRKETGDVTGWISLSLLKAERTFADILSPFPSPPDVTYSPIFDRRLDVDLVLRYPLPWGWTGGLRWNLGTGTPYTRAVGSYAYYSPQFVQGQGRLEWAGASDATDDLGGYAVVLGDRNSSRYPTYHRLDVSFRRDIHKSWGVLTPYLDLVNLYNKRNVLFYFYEYDRAPPTRSGISMFPLLPTFGLEVHF
ncbi:MAG: TonB-dependent receptor [Gemmatimonadetes bacterium]|nr:TonB-dependent receptor [Gemmatimonadota bacterium]